MDILRQGGMEVFFQKYHSVGMFFLRMKDKEILFFLNCEAIALPVFNFLVVLLEVDILDGW
jgi:hypothetical protein